MSDKNSDKKPIIEEGVVGIVGNPKTLDQLSSSGRAAQRKRMGKALESLGKAVKDLKDQTESSNGGEGQGK